MVVLPRSAAEFMNWSWDQIEPFYAGLLDQRLNQDRLTSWLDGWNQLRVLVDESYSRLLLENARDTTDLDAERRYHSFLENVYPRIQSADQKLKEKLLASELQPVGFEMPIRNMRAEKEIFREANLPLITQEHKLGTRYNKIVAAQTVSWRGEEVTLPKLRARMQALGREERREAWQLSAQRQLADRKALNDLWVEFLTVRCQLAANAGFDNYRSYRWKQLLRFDYTPQDCQEFRQAILQVVVPAARRIYERYRSAMDANSLRPWDLDLDIYPLQSPPLPPYGSVDEMKSKAEAIFRQVNQAFGDYYAVICKEGLLDLENRLGKAPGAFCISFAVQKRPFVFMNAVGLHSDVRTLLHECGHAFHVFERSRLPYHHQWRPGMEFAEVASMSMELLAAPYLSADQGGFYSPGDSDRALAIQLERILLFWPYMAVVDAFQHWVYENQTAAMDPANCDTAWGKYWYRFMPATDWSGLEAEMQTGWQRKLHIFRHPFYYIEYGLAQLGSVQVWGNALLDQPHAVSAYRQALALGGTADLPALFATAGARLGFDAATLSTVVEVLEDNLGRLYVRLPS